MSGPRPLTLVWLLCFGASACSSARPPATAEPDERSEADGDRQEQLDGDEGLDAPGSDDLDAPDDEAHAANVITFDDESDPGGPADTLRAAPRREDIPSFELFGAGGRGGPGQALTIPDDADEPPG